MVTGVARVTFGAIPGDLSVLLVAMDRLLALVSAFLLLSVPERPRAGETVARKGGGECSGYSPLLPGDKEKVKGPLVHTTG